MRSSKNSCVPGYSFGIFLKFLCATTFMQSFIARAQLVQNLSWGEGGGGALLTSPKTLISKSPKLVWAKSILLIARLTISKNIIGFVQCNFIKLEIITWTGQ